MKYDKINSLQKCKKREGNVSQFDGSAFPFFVIIRADSHKMYVMYSEYQKFRNGSERNMKRFKSFLCNVKTWIGCLLAFIGLFFAGGFFLIVGICIGVFSAMWSVLERLRNLFKEEKTEKPVKKMDGYETAAGTAARRIGGCRTTAGTIGKILVMAGVMGMVKIAVKLKGE